MIVREPQSWVRMLFTRQGTGLTEISPRLAAIVGFSVLITVAELHWDVPVHPLTPVPFALFGVVMGLFLGFRNNAAYDRYWEGRKLWGGIVNTSRNLVRQSLNWSTESSAADSGSEPHGPLQREIGLKTVAYVYGLKNLLRDSSPEAEVSPFLNESERLQILRSQNVPLAILQKLTETLQRLWRSGGIHDMHVPLLEQSISGLTDLQGGCERIKNTPIPYSYTVLIHRIVASYCFLLPLGIVDSVRWFTPVVVALISHAFLGIDEIGSELEDPFGTEMQDLPLSAICRTIEINLLELLGEPNLPKPLEPVNGVLL